MNRDTIYAESTPKGPGALSIIRLSGSNTLAILQTISRRSSFSPHVQHLTHLVNSAGAFIDQGMVVFHPGPYSYTGEDLAEISCHGNPMLVSAVIDVINSTKLARQAQRGEFTKRAYLEGKLSLAQAEAVDAVIRAKTPTGLEMARSLLKDDIPQQLTSICQDVQKIITEIEASFLTDEDLSPQLFQTVISAVLEQVSAYLDHAREASSVYDGINVTIAGLPNAGKSSLFNAIVGYPRAIVHAEAGTTRDVIREHVNIDGLNFIFHDTAGIKTTSIGPEKIGVEKTIESLGRSDLVLYVVDTCLGLQTEEIQWLRYGKKTIIVMNKIDLCPTPACDAQEFTTVSLSAKFHQGLEKLLEAMHNEFPKDLPHIFLQRHINLLEMVQASLETCLETIVNGLTPDVLTIDLDHALKALQALSGTQLSGDILDSIFSNFCIGK
ncbi:MAG: tRNA uridine-5-carboxymethylaminomethyl(34) synthesis GTPase MnmE [Deltaproteobacteria bacterium]|nr:tRNA uridine-5-carboxymethylaminomethyl(34) synthesis GTPase MnmE [Deltaproteobacteria bacterium]